MLNDDIQYMIYNLNLILILKTLDSSIYYPKFGPYLTLCREYDLAKKYGYERKLFQNLT